MSVLEEHFRKRGVTMMALAPQGATPLHFGNPVAEHLATRRVCGLFDFSFMACVEIHGRHSLPFLHRLQTRNLVRLVPGRIAYTLMLREDGSVLNDATVWCLDENHYALFVGRHADVAHLRRLAHDFDVALSEHLHDQAVIAVQGVQALRLLQGCFADIPTQLPYFGFCTTTMHGKPCRIARIGYSGETGYEIIIDAVHAAGIWEALRGAGAVECGFEAINTLRIEAGHVLFSAELAQPVMPSELGLSRLVDRYAADFIGRKHLYETAPRSRLVGLHIERMPDESLASLTGNHVHARITSACYAPTLQRAIALGFVGIKDAAPGTSLRLGADLRATVTRLPFYDPAKYLARRTH